jgi:hypothetical protein
MKPPLTDFISAGFLITRPVARPSYVSADLMPDEILSASGCIAKFIPDTWCLEWSQDTPESRIERARAFGLDATGLTKAAAWVTPRFGDSIGWPNVVMSLQVAKQLVESLLSTLPEVKVLELALHKCHTGEFCRAAEPPPPKPGFSPMGRSGVYEAVLKSRPPAGGGCVLGYELLVFDMMVGLLSCSWLCNSLDGAVAEKLNIRPNRRGFIETFDDASRCREFISRAEVGAEPGLWLPWLISDCTEMVQQPH